MKRLALFSLMALFLVGCTTHQKYAGATKRKQHRFIPSEFHNLYLGMAKKDALAARPTMKMEQVEDFREIYSEEIGRDHIVKAIYYFDDEGKQPLYEFILLYDTEAHRDAVAKKILGEPNFEGQEWIYPSKEGFRIHAWKFKNKLIIAGKIAGTEWAEEQGR